MSKEICEKCLVNKRLFYVKRYHGVTYTHFCNNVDCMRFEEEYRYEKI